MRLIVGFALVTTLSPAALAAQGPVFTPSANPVTEAVRGVFAKESKNLVASADLLPAEKYGYRPTPAQMTFGQLVAHIIQTNFAICGGISATPVPMTADDLMKVDETGGKAKLVPLLRQSFDYCADALAKITDARLSEEAAFFGRGMGQSRASALITIATDWADHYSTAAAYLRLSGILPPSAQPPAARPAAPAPK